MKFGNFLLVSLSVPTLILNKASAQSSSVLLIVNDSNPSAVTITATGNVPTATCTDIMVNYGADLLSFFTSDAFTGGTGIGESSWHWSGTGFSLTANGAGVPYATAEADNLSTDASEDYQGAYVDLNLYVAGFDTGSANLQDFNTAQTAFTGSLTINFTSFGIASLLPPPGSSGYVVDGDVNSLFEVGASIIGTWEVPLPTINILSSSVTGTNLNLSFVTTTTNLGYTVWGSTNLAATDWISVTNVAGSGGVTNSVTVPMKTPAQYFRVSAP